MSIPIARMTREQARTIVGLSGPTDAITIDPQKDADAVGWLRVTIGSKPYLLDDQGAMLEDK
jgi:hypothetical protein